MTDNRIKIATPDRVLRIMQRICEANLPLMIRGEGDSSVGVKGRAAEIFLFQQGPLFRMDSISERGMQHLASSTKFQVEFVLSETQILFVASVVSRDSSSVILRLPKSLVSIERRKKARYVCSPSMRAFVSLSLWQPSSDDPLTPPFYAHHAALGGYLNLADLSMGGMCFFTRFPALGQSLKRGQIDHHARLYFPMLPPVEAKMEIRWVKRIKEHSKNADMDDFFHRFYRFGGEFIEPSEPLNFALRQFIQQLSQEGAL